MKRLLSAILAIMLVLPMLQSCNSNDDGPNTVYYTTIVTFEKNDGPYMNFSYQQVDDSPLIILQARGQMDTKSLPDGSRTLITYSYANKDAVGGSGFINLLDIKRIYTDTVTTVASVPADFFERQYRTVALQRSGQWINLYCETGFVENFFSRKFTIVADEATLGDEYPQLYLGTSLTQNAVLGVDARTFVSVNINPVWSLPTCKGVDIHVYKTSPTDKDVYRFVK